METPNPGQETNIVTQGDILCPNQLLKDLPLDHCLELPLDLFQSPSKGLHPSKNTIQTPLPLPIAKFLVFLKELGIIPPISPKG